MHFGSFEVGEILLDYAHSHTQTLMFPIHTKVDDKHQSTAVVQILT